MKQIKVNVICPTGIHGRQACVVVMVAKKFNCEINITFEGRTVDMKSIMGVMSLGIATQSEIIITCNGDDEDLAIEVIDIVLFEQKITGISKYKTDKVLKHNYFLRKLKDILK